MMLPWYLRRTIMYPLIIGTVFAGGAALVLMQAGCSGSSAQAEPAPAVEPYIDGPTLIGKMGDCELYEVRRSPGKLSGRLVWITRCPNDVAMTVLNP